MKRSEQWDYILSLAQALDQNGSWCGETHLQKACFFLQELTEVPLDLDFILYKHGPFSFPLREELDLLKSAGRLLQVPRPPYGPSLKVGPEATANQVSSRPVAFVAEKLGPKGVMELEQVATALFLLKEDPQASDLARKLVEVKPHVSLAQADHALGEAGQLMNAWQEGHHPS